MTKLTIQLLQTPTITANDVPFLLRDDKTWGLLTYLLVHHDQPQRREHLAVLLWPEKSGKASRANLRKLLFHLRRALDQVDPQLADDLLTTTAQTVTLRKLGGISADIWHVQAGLAVSTLAAETLPIVQHAVSAYQNELLPNLVIDSAEPFNNWLDQQRDQLQQGVKRLLVNLTTYHTERDNAEAAMAYSEQLLRVAPFDEEALRQSMALFAKTGRRAQAVKLYRQFSQRLASRVDLQPERATRQLALRIQQSEQAAIPSHHTHLPAPTTALIGRSREREALNSRLNDTSCRLLTLIGLSGVGKTHLALTVARDAGAAMWEAVYFVALDPAQPLRTEDALAGQLANGLQLIQHATDLRQRLERFLGGNRRVLLFIDNFEYAIEAATLLPKLLSAAAHLTICVTSQLPLRLRAEHLFEVASLTLPADDTLAALEESGAGQLFLARGRQVRPNYAPDSAECRAIHTICHLTGGLPLALELAAIRLRQSRAQTIARQLQASIMTLTTDLRDYPNRHQTIAAAFDSTWQLLDAPMQRAFLRLTVFRAGFQMEMGVVVGECSADLIRQLHANRLLQRRDQRYSIHPLLREIGVTRLAEDGAHDHATRRAHADTFATYLAQQGARLDDAEMLTVLEEMVREYGNCQQAWHWLIAQKSWDTLAHCCEGFTRFFERTMRLQEGETQLTMAIERVETDALRCLLLTHRARLEMLRRRYAQTEETIRQALPLAEKLEQTQLIARNLLCLAAARYQQGQTSEAIPLLARAQPLCEPYPLLRTLCKEYQAGVAYRRGAFDSAEKYYKAAHQFYLIHAPRFPKQRAVVANNLANIAYVRGNIAEAHERYTTALQLRSRNVPQSRFGGIVTQANLGLVALAQLRFEDALDHFMVALDAHRESGNRFGEGRVIGYLGELYLEMGDLDRALQYSERALAIQEMLGQTSKRSRLYAFLALIWLKRDQLDKARSFAQQAILRADEQDERDEWAFAHTVLGHIMLATGETDKAQDHFQRAAATHAKLGQTMRRLEPLAGLAVVALRQQRHADALAHIEPILQQMERVGHLDGVVDRGRVQVICEMVAEAAYAAVGDSGG